MRKHWLDNLRWFTVLLVLFFHVIYIFNNKGVEGGLGGFVEGPSGQPQDIVMYILYPWFMMLLFLLAGISARYALEKKEVKTFLKDRTRKLIVPATIGLFVFQWIVGYFNTRAVAATGAFDQLTTFNKWMLYALSGVGPLWFAQELWAFSLILIIIRKLDSKDKFRKLCAKSNWLVILLLGILFWFGSQFMIFESDTPNPKAGLVNLYRPLAYLIPFLMGYFVFSNDSVLQRLKKGFLPIALGALASGIALCITGWGTCPVQASYLAGWLNCLYAWMMALAMMGIFLNFFDRTNRIFSYLSRINYGLYVLHYPVLLVFAYFFKEQTQMSPWLIYPLLTILVFTLTPALYELIHRIPFVRWAVLGEKKVKNCNDTLQHM